MESYLILLQKAVNFPIKKRINDFDFVIEQCFIRGILLWGNYIENNPSRSDYSQEDCQVACFAEPDCNAWSWYTFVETRLQRCKLFTNFDANINRNIYFSGNNIFNSMSGPKICKGNYSE